MHNAYERNIFLYGILKIFTKRVFLPVTTVYLVLVGHLSVPQIGILAAVSAVVSLLSEIPTGYLADRLTRRAALIMCGLLAAIGTLFYAFWPQFPGAVIATVFDALGYSFLSGAAEALIHDSLVILKRSHDYPRVVGRAQSFGLMGNVVLVALIPLTYEINPRVPFLFGTLAYLSLIGVAMAITEPPRTKMVQTVNPAHDLAINLHRFVSRSSLLFFICVGIISALNTTSSDFTNLVFKDLGLKPSMFGLVFAGGSIVGIIGGFYIHHLRKLKALTYTWIDTLVFSGFFLIIGLGRNLTLVIISFALYMGFWRLRAIMYQHYLLQIFGRDHYKATLISTLNFFIRCNEVWLPTIFVISTTRLGYYHGYNVIGVATLVCMLPLFWLAIKLFDPKSQ
ncbi:MAG TPA: MFS transporter [Candidatus Limnocylindrales bacterium]|nr:MFS transporter [Candidatus Limnocylindrales bacterium]